ncbi:MAG: gfo/Idh/MocA family oxidoreductase [Nitrospirae bacterium]|nr:MAG: gfo/Idh/MocA family oxidoreductase [Nitrospirota bacterium]
MSVASNPIEVLIIGAGMYVCGRGTSGTGTILPAVFQAHRDGLVDRVLVAATCAESLQSLHATARVLNQQLGTDIHVEGFPSTGRNPKAYLGALGQLGPRGCVIVSVPDPLHYEVARAVLEAQRHLLMVKPFTPTVTEGKALVQLAREKGLYGAIEFHKRWDLMHLKLQQLVEEGRLGTPLYACVEFSQKKMIPERIFRQWAERTNIFQYLGVHYVDILAHVFKAVPTRAMGVGQYGYLKAHKIETFDAIEALVEWYVPGSNTPFVSAFLVNWIDPNSTSAMSYQSLKIVGTSGRYESDQKHRGLQIVTDDSGIEEINPYFTQVYPDGSQRCYRGYGIESVTSFLHDVRNLFDGAVTLQELERTRPTFRQGLLSTAVLEAVGRSLQECGAWVPVQDVREV